MKIYRFVNDKGNGLYQDFFNEKIGFVKIGEDIPRHQPWLYDDYTLWGALKTKKKELERLQPVNTDKFIEKHNFAFTNQSQILRWFGTVDPLIVLTEGGQLLEIDIDEKHVIKSPFQCMYLRNKINSSQAMNLDDYINFMHEHDAKYRELPKWCQ